VENQTQVSHSSHRPLEIWPTPPDFHIPTAQACAAWKSGKPDPGFPLSHTAQATTATVLFSPEKQKPGKEVGRYAASPSESFSGSSCIGIKPRFRIILGLENAYRVASVPAISRIWPSLVSITLLSLRLRLNVAELELCASQYGRLAQVGRVVLKRAAL